ncbi:MAG: ParA family protein [archaeon]
MKKICVINQKGGTGKTTVAVNLSHGLALKGKKVLVIDADGQGHTTIHFGHTPKKTLYDILIDKVDPKDVIVNIRPNLDLIPADRNLRAVPMKISGEPGRDFLLKNALAKIKGYDYVIIDCGPNLDALNFNVFVYADEALIPINMEFLTAHGTAEMVSTTFEAIKRNMGHELLINGVVGVFYDRRTKKSKEMMDLIKKYFKDKVYDTVIRINTKISEAPSDKKTIFEYDPKSTGTEDFKMLAEEFMRRG